MSRESVISRTQYGIYLECVSNPEATTYNCPFLLYIPESIPMEVIRESIIKTVDAHEALTSRPYMNDRGEVVLKSGYPIETKTYELSDEEFADRKNNLVRPFSMDGEALARIEFYITPTQKYMFTDINHLVFDGTSFNTIFTEFSKALNGEEIQPESFTCHDINDEELNLRNSEEYDKLLEGNSKG